MMAKELNKYAASLNIFKSPGLKMKKPKRKKSLKKKIQKKYILIMY